ncbi:MAG: glutamate racemase [Clostridia bacterium]|nr:glutamate racemase [Clostridia bacterium]
MENRKPIGVFDSGLGGLTALGALRRLMPNEDVIYFGDSARIPYGTKSPTVIKKFALQDTRFLMSLGVKAILIACGTVSSNCLDDVEAVAGVPVVGVIDEAARQAADIAKNGKNRVAVLGTSATVNSGAFEKELRKNGVGEIINQACPMFVPLVENWHHSVEDTATNAIVSEYIDPVAKKSPDAVILGCTHYPLLADVISKYLPDTKLISSGEAAALGIKKLLTEKCLLNDVGGKTEFYTSGGEKLFSQNASRFLGEDIAVSATHIDIENY